MVKTVLTVSLLLFVTWTTAAVTPPPHLDRALEAQAQLVTDNPYDGKVHNDMGNLLVLAGRFDEAEVSYLRSIELEPTDPELRFNYALLLQQSGRIEEAEGEFLHVLEIRPRHAWALYQMGVISAGRGDRNKALDLYARAFAYDSSLTFARNNPHIIENPLTTEALLLSSRYQSAPGARVPRYYGDADRIRALMIEDVLPQTEGEGVGQDAGTPGTEGQGGGGAATGTTGGTRQMGSTEGAVSVEPRESSRRAGTSERGATAPRGGTTVVVPGGRRVGASESGGSGSDTTARRPRATTRGQADTQRQDRTGAQSGRNVRPPRRPGYRPPVRSTGRLELELLPQGPGSEKPAEVVAG